MDRASPSPEAFGRVSAGAPPKPGSTDFRLLRFTMRARWLRRRRSEDARYAVATDALPSHPPGDARDGAHRWLRAQRDLGR